VVGGAKEAHEIRQLIVPITVQAIDLMQGVFGANGKRREPGFLLGQNLIGAFEEGFWDALSCKKAGKAFIGLSGGVLLEEPGLDETIEAKSHGLGEECETRKNRRCPEHDTEMLS
jgi:hypothetical protein